MPCQMCRTFVTHVWMGEDRKGSESLISFAIFSPVSVLRNNRMGMGVHAAGTAAGWGQGLPGGPQLPPHHATTVTAPPGVQAAPPPPPPPAQMMAYPMQQFQVNVISFIIRLFTGMYALHWLSVPLHLITQFFIVSSLSHVMCSFILEFHSTFSFHFIILINSLI